MNKIYPLKILSKIIKKEKKLKKKIILCHGVFDLLHVGHIKHLEKAKQLGDKLIVTITSDKHVNKGPGRPIFNQKLRSESIAALECVDYVAINDNKTAVEPIKIIKPNIYCKGKDYKDLKDDLTGEIKNELNILKKYNGEVIFTEELTFSSSRIINKSTDYYSLRHKKNIKKISKVTNFTKIKKIIDDFKKIKILVIGETIIDQYNFCEAIGKSGKEPIMVLRETEKEQYLGGVLGIARHLSELVNKVMVISMLGEKKEYFQDIKKDLPKNIKTKFIYKKNSPTIVKKRYVDHISKYKVFGMYNFNDEILNKKNELTLNKILEKELKKYDLVIVSDYGHGFISKKSANIICSKSKFLALNTQINASNIGYHTIKNYKNFNTLIINEKEIRHEMRDKASKVESLMTSLTKAKNIKNLIVTMGRSGSVLYNQAKNKFFYADAYANNVVDKIGAGDTMLAVVALCIKFNIDNNVSLLISSLAAAQSVENMGNKYSINKINMLKALETILK